MESSSNKRNEKQYSCPVEITLDVIGGKWKGVVLYHLIDGKKRFGELKKLYPRISQRILTLQLRELEEDGIVKRTVYPEVPPRVEYALTNFGESLVPIIQELKKWGQTYDEKVIRMKRENN